MKLIGSILVPAAVLAHAEQQCDDYIIDLGYAKHAVSWTNITTHGTTLLNYNNIRYAQPPLSDLRFRRPAVPPPTNVGISFGNLTISEDEFLPPTSSPPQGFPSSWQTDCLSSAPAVVPFPLLNGSTWGSEDCLLLNVIKPAHARPGDKLPVLHWVIGSAFAFGSKDWTGFGINTYGLWNKPYNLPDNFIVVTHNYRLGVPGWTPKFEDDMNGNLGVWDSLAAIEWTEKYIDRFGGDPDNITVIGQSAGAAIIAWMLLAQNGTMKLPFDQAWIASPTLPPRRNLERNRPVWNTIMNATKCTNVACLRSMSTDTMRATNEYLLNNVVPDAGGGSLGPGVGFTPTVDGELVSDLPLNLLANRKINKGIKHLVIGNTAAEGMGLSSDTDMPERFPQIVRGNIPNATDGDVQTIEELYTYPPELPEKLAWNYTTDVDWTCNVANFANAYKNIARRQLFSVPPATHGLDLVYQFYDNRTISLPRPQDVEIAYASQAILLQFMFRRDFDLPADAPFAMKLSDWPVYSGGGVFANLSIDGFKIGPVPLSMRERTKTINDLVRDPSKGV